MPNLFSVWWIVYLLSNKDATHYHQNLFPQQKPSYSLMISILQEINYIIIHSLKSIQVNRNMRRSRAGFLLHFLIFCDRKIKRSRKILTFNDHTNISSLTNNLLTLQISKENTHHSSVTKYDITFCILLTLGESTFFTCS